MGQWRDMTEEELEKQYSPSQWSHRMEKEAVIEAHVRELMEGTRRAQDTVQTRLHVPYGESDGEKLDLYLPTDPCAAFPLLLYVHGGYWQFLSKEVSGFAAPLLVTQGVAMAAVGYDVAPKGRMDVMVAQVRRSVAFLVQQYPEISGVYLCGHSAGAHLVAMALSTDWAEYGVTPNIKGAFLVSGVYDLEPITHTYVNIPLQMSREAARAHSPMLHVTEPPARTSCEVLVAVAQHDSPEFHRQSCEYFQALRSAGWTVHLLDIAGTDHFDVIEKLAQGSYILTQVILNMITRA